MIPKWISVFAVFIVLTACSVESGPDIDPPVDPPTEQPGIVRNNAAVLTGATLGRAEADVQQLRKEVSVNVATPNATFRLGEFYASRPSLETDTLYWTLPLTNIGDETRCFIRAVDISFRDAEGGILAAEKRQFVDGSVGVLSSVYTNTCLEPNETGYVQGIQTDSNVDVYSTLASVDIGELEIDPNVPNAPDIRVIPQRYAVSMNQELSVSAKNEGDELGYVTDAVYVLLDADDAPLLWGFLDRTWDGEIAPGETRNLVQDIDYEGQAEKMRVIVNFDGESPTSDAMQGVSAQGLSGAETDAERLRQRNAREQRKLEQLGTP